MADFPSENDWKKIRADARAGSKTAAARKGALQNHPPLGKKQRNPPRKQTPRLEKGARNVKIRFRARLRKIRPPPRRL
jgi:hypothetical protein